PAGEHQGVRQHQGDPDEDEESEPGPEDECAGDADRTGGENGDGGEPDEHRGGDPGAQRPPGQLVPSVRPDPQRAAGGRLVPPPGPFRRPRPGPRTPRGSATPLTAAGSRGQDTTGARQPP